MITEQLRAILDAMNEEDLYEVSELCARIRAKRKREEKRREEAREENRIEKEPHISRARTRGIFTPPTTDEVAAYCKERNNKVDPIQFCSYYEAKGWIVGKTRMKNWRAAVRTWERLEIKYTTERAAERKAREKRSYRGGGWTPPPICNEYKEAQLAELRKAGLI